MPKTTTVGLISDTHGLLRPEARAALAGCELLLHAGDVGSPEVLEELAELAPLHAVRGNVDRGAWADALPEELTVEVDGLRIRVLHDASALDSAEGLDVVVSGHSHQPARREERGVLWVNPGSAGPRRFRLPISVARLTVRSGRADAELIRLDEACERS